MSQKLLAMHRRIEKDWKQEPTERYHNPNGGPRYLGLPRTTVNRVIARMMSRDVASRRNWLLTRWKGIKSPTPEQIRTMRYEDA